MSGLLKRVGSVLGKIGLSGEREALMTEGHRVVDVVVSIVFGGSLVAIGLSLARKLGEQGMGLGNGQCIVELEARLQRKWRESILVGVTTIPISTTLGKKFSFP